MLPQSSVNLAMCVEEIKDVKPYLHSKVFNMSISKSLNSAQCIQWK